MSSERPATPEVSRFWKRPDLLIEEGEFERTARTLAPERDQKQFVRSMQEGFVQAPMQELTDEDWSRLENSDSWEITPGDFKKVADLSKEYVRDFEKFKRAFESGSPVSAPTIIRYGDRLHKVGGNTRLMVARAMGIRPMVLIAEVK